MHIGPTDSLPYPSRIRRPSMKCSTMRCKLEQYPSPRVDVMNACSMGRLTRRSELYETKIDSLVWPPNQRMPARFIRWSRWHLRVELAFEMSRMRVVSTLGGPPRDCCEEGVEPS